MEEVEERVGPLHFFAITSYNNNNNNNVYVCMLLKERARVDFSFIFYGSIIYDNINHYHRATI